MSLEQADERALRGPTGWPRLSRVPPKQIQFIARAPSTRSLLSLARAVQLCFDLPKDSTRPSRGGSEADSQQDMNVYESLYMYVAAHGVDAWCRTQTPEHRNGYMRVSIRISEYETVCFMIGKTGRG